jgi:Uma2 family endonuclease
MPLPEKQKYSTYSYKDYLSWNDGERWEIINGAVYSMTPAPSRRHQDISRELGFQIASYLKGKMCTLYYAPFDVRLPDYPDQPDNEITNVVQPDLLVVCDRTKLDDKGLKGAPDWIIEILSPSTSLHDMTVKYSLYEKAGIKEYWIVDPANALVTVYTLIDGRYIRSGVFGKNDNVPSGIFKDLLIDMTQVIIE